jgi:hypothetical protein
MRIILTPLGQDLVKKLNEEKDSLRINRYEEEKFKSKNKERDSNSRGRKDVHTSQIAHAGENYNQSLMKNSYSTFGQTVKYKNPHSLKHKSDLLNKLEMDQTTISLEELHASKEIQIKQKKLNIPKNVTERYNLTSDSKNNSLTKILPMPVMIKKDLETFDQTNYGGTLNSTSPHSRNKFTLKEVLDENSVKLLKTNYIQDKRMKDKLSRVDEMKFRSNYESKNFLEKLDEKLSRKINPDRINLIRYLNEKDQVSEVLIKKIADYDEEQINKINKICQIVLHNNERSKLFKDIIQEKLTALKNREKIEYKSYIENMGKNMQGFSSVLQNYEKKVNNKEKYRDIHNDIVKNHWQKHNVDRIARRTNFRSTQNLSSFNDFNTQTKDKDFNISKMISSENSVGDF